MKEEVNYIMMKIATINSKELTKIFGFKHHKNLLAVIGGDNRSQKDKLKELSNIGANPDDYFRANGSELKRVSYEITRRGVNLLLATTKYGKNIEIVDTLDEYFNKLEETNEKIERTKDLLFKIYVDNDDKARCRLKQQVLASDYIISGYGSVEAFDKFVHELQVNPDAMKKFLGLEKINERRGMEYEN